MKISEKGQRFLSDLETALDTEWVELRKDILQEAERWYTKDAPLSGS